MKNGGGHFAPELGGHFELESGGHFKLELGGQYHWNLQPTAWRDWGFSGINVFYNIFVSAENTLLLLFLTSPSAKTLCTIHAQNWKNKG
jgi:hypothetical protein